MDWLTFSSNIVGSLAWPLVVIGLLILLRRHLAGLAGRLEELTLPGGTKAKFAKQLDIARLELVDVEQPRFPGGKKIATALDSAIARGAEEPRPPSRQEERERESTLEYLKLANLHPEAAVLQAYREIEGHILDVRDLVSEEKATSAVGIVELLRSRGLLDERTFELFMRIRNLRSLAVHSKDRITPGEAIEYRALCRALFERLANVFFELRTVSPPRP
jgi:hypothetical protein